ncbi:MAG: hypothetical protein E7231_07465 [Cellulosilyticum sp.]|nr:hypothetical protein [Cellulosilyticum sp.]
MKEQTKIIELPFNQLELAQLELFLNREREDNWVLVKTKGHQLYFEKRTGALYCYEVRLHITPKDHDTYLVTAKEQHLRWIKEQEQVGWYFIGEVQDWYIFRSLIEGTPIKTKKDYEREYKALRKNFFEKNLGGILSKGIVLVILLCIISFFSPLDLVCSNYVIGMEMASILLMIWGIFELKTWLHFKYKIYKYIRNGGDIEPNEKLLSTSRIRRRNRGIILGSVVGTCIGGMLLDGFFAESVPIILMTVCIAARVCGAYLEKIQKAGWAKVSNQIKKRVYAVCWIGIIGMGLFNCLFNMQESYEGEEALKIKARMNELSLITLKNQKTGALPIALSVNKEERSTLFLRRFLQYDEWQGESYIYLNYYETWSMQRGETLFDFILKVKKIDKGYGYQKVEASSYGMDEVYINEYGSAMYLRKGRHIIEVEYTSEDLTSLMWQKRIRHMATDLV